MTTPARRDSRGEGLSAVANSRCRLLSTPPVGAIAFSQSSCGATDKEELSSIDSFGGALRGRVAAFWDGRAGVNIPAEERTWGGALGVGAVIERDWVDGSGVGKLEGGCGGCAKREAGSVPWSMTNREGLLSREGKHHAGRALAAAAGLYLQGPSHGVVSETEPGARA